MSQHYAFYLDSTGFETFDIPEFIQDQHPAQERFFALSPDSVLADRPARSKARETLQGKDRTEKQSYFARERQAQEGLMAERLLTRSQTLENKLLEKNGARKP